MPYLVGVHDDLSDWSERGTSPEHPPPPAASQLTTKGYALSDPILLADDPRFDSSSSSDVLLTIGPLGKINSDSEVLEDDFASKSDSRSSAVTLVTSSSIATPVDDSSDALTELPQARRANDRRPSRKSTAQYGQARQVECVKVPPRIFPESFFSPALPSHDRQDVAALAAILQSKILLNNCSYGDEIFTSVDLINFCIYENPKVRESRALVYDLPEFCSLHDWYERPGKVAPFLFDGTLVVDNQLYHVRHVPSEHVSIGAFCDIDEPSVGQNLWIASSQGVSKNVWYRLRSPETAYARFFETFRWHADLCKHVVDFLHIHQDEDVRLWHFTSAFFEQTSERHHRSSQFAAWLKQYGSTDFKRALSAYPGFFRSQACGTDEKFGNFRLWRDMASSSLVNHSVAAKQGDIVPPTIVTPYVHNCFRDTWFNQILKPTKITVKSDHLCLWEKAFNGRSPKATRQVHDAQFHRADLCGVVKVGDVVAVSPDDEATSNWRKDKAEVWYLFVSDVEQTKSRRKLKGLWLYDSSQTLMENTPYLYRNELFLSDHCNCDSGNDAALFESDILGIEPVKFYHDGSSSLGSKTKFVRQAWKCNDHAFETLKSDHFHCEHVLSPLERYEVGMTVLVKGLSSLLEPVIITKSIHDQKSVRVRRLLRKSLYSPPAAPNELILTDEDVSIAINKIEMQCTVRCFGDSEAIPRPYSSNGTGNLFYIRYTFLDGSLTPLTSDPGFIQGFDPRQKAEFAVSCLDLFCGSGNLGFGIDDSGAAITTHAVDMDKHAIHTKMANHADPESCLFYWGSVDDLLREALTGQFKHAPHPGQVGIITAGSPCQGFSRMNQHRNNPESLKNVSMIASVMAFVDLYRPKYLVLENVLSMAETNSATGQNALSYVLACLVGMGYQTQQFNCDACTDGAAQNRSRIIVVATAPGLTLLSPPGRSHKYKETHHNRALGKAANGLKFGGRVLDAPKAFDVVSIAEATAHLPHNPDGRLGAIPYPDHVIPRSGFYLRALLENIPRIPGANATTGLRQSHTPDSVRLCHSSTSAERGWENTRSCQRLNSEGITPTIIASYAPEDSRVGTLIHWREDRSLTIEEARIAQQFPTDFVLLGDRRARWELVGNAVPRGLAQALGISLRQALEKDWNRAFKADGGIPTRIDKTEKVKVDKPHLDVYNSSSIREETLQEATSSNVDATVCSRVSHKRKRRRISTDGLLVMTESESEREETFWKKMKSAGPCSTPGGDTLLPSKTGHFATAASVEEMEEETKRSNRIGDESFKAPRVPAIYKATYERTRTGTDLPSPTLCDKDDTDNDSDVIIVSSKSLGGWKW